MFNKKDFYLRTQIHVIVKDNNLNNLKCFKVNFQFTFKFFGIVTRRISQICI